MSSRFVLDTSCIIALLCTWHPHHRAVMREVGRRLDEGGSMIVSAHAVTETYWVHLFCDDARGRPREAVPDNGFSRRLDPALVERHRGPNLRVPGGTIVTILARMV